MAKDVARLREQEAETAREKIAEIQSGEELIKERARLEEAQKIAQERELLETETKVKEEFAQSEALRRARQNAEFSAGKEEANREELEKESLRAQFREAQAKEEEERRKFLENVAKQSGEEAEPTPVWPAPPRAWPEPLSAEAPKAKAEPILPVEPIIPAPPEIPSVPAAPETTIPPPLPAESPKKPFKFPSVQLPKVQLPKIQIPKVQLPKVQLPKIEGYFPAKSSIFAKIWIRIIVSLFVLAILATIATFWYWYLVIRERPVSVSEKIEKPRITEETTAPLPLIPTESLRTIEIANSAELPALLSLMLQENLGDGKFARILIKNTTEKKFWGLSDFFEVFQVKTPENFYNNINIDFTLFIFSRTAKNQLGFVARTDNPVVLRAVMESWEKTLKNDSNGLFSFLGNGEGITIQPFSKFIYKNATMHYTSFAENFGIVWTVTDNYLIFTSSGESAIKTIDKIKE